MSSLKASDEAAAAVAVGARVSLADIENAIVARFDGTGESFLGNMSNVARDVERTAIIGPLKILSLCVLVLRNGFTIVGKSAPASPENFNAELGRKFAYEDAVRQIWPLMGFSLRDRLAKGAASLISLFLLFVLLSFAAINSAYAQADDHCTDALVSTNHRTMGAQAVATITPPSGQFVYVCHIDLEAIHITATQMVNPPTSLSFVFTSSGLDADVAASPQWGLSSPARADVVLPRAVDYSPPRKSSAAGQAVTISSPAAQPNVAFGIKVRYRVGP